MGSQQIDQDSAVDTISLLEVFGLQPASTEPVHAAQDGAIAAVAPLWPLAGAALVLAAAITFTTAFLEHAAQASVVVAALASPVVLLALFTWIPLRPRARDAVAAHVRIARVTIPATLLAAPLSLMLSIAPAAPGSPLNLATLVAGFGAIILTVIALRPLRAALLGFTIVLAMMVAVNNGFGIAAVIALLLVTLLATGMLRQARRDRLRLDDEARLQDQSRLASRLVENHESHGTGWFWQTDRQGQLTYLSAKVAQELAAFGGDPLGRRLAALLRVDSELIDTERTLTFHLSSRTSFADYSVRLAFDDASERRWSISGRPVIDDLGRFQGFIGSGSDLTETRRVEAEITRLALFDGLTGLANRQRMRLSLEQTLQQNGQQGGPTATALLLLDLDRFKAVNDTLGHQVGDALLKQVALRLQRTVGDAGLVGRLGGDEFEVVLPREGARDVLSDLARDVIATLSQPYFIEGSSIAIGCSIGIAVAPEHGQDAETLVRNADLALYAAKADGRGVHRFYRAELLEGAQSRKRLEDDLRLALQKDQLYLTYQPVVSTADARIVGYEALVRWQHPTRGAISPADFIPVAEECGLIEAIGEWVLRTAVAEATKWPEWVRVAVNVSPIQFANPVLPSIVTNALAANALSPRRLELEITEGVFLNDDAATDQMFRALKGIGVRLALDDFGTGYSSLGYLKKAPFDKIKIDQSFVRGAIEPGNRNAAIIKAIVTLAETLGLETTAEGVEQQDEIALIRGLGCSHIQGFVYGRPARAADVLIQLAQDDGHATPIGHKVSRATRSMMLRSARIVVGTEQGEVRIRNISSTGAMIDGVAFPPDAVGVEVLIELLEDQLFPATIRWAKGGKAGLEFAESFNMERLNPPASRVRRTG